MSSYDLVEKRTVFAKLVQKVQFLQIRKCAYNWLLIYNTIRAFAGIIPQLSASLWSVHVSPGCPGILLLCACRIL